MSQHAIEPFNKEGLIKKLLANDIEPGQLLALRNMIRPDDLAYIVQHIYDLNENYISRLSVVEGVLKKMNAIKNAKRNRRFIQSINDNFRDGTETNNKVILAEGDSWFNYPIILTDIVDRISMEKDLAVYSIAAGGDWLLNMLSGREYVDELSIIHPDFF